MLAELINWPSFWHWVEIHTGTARGGPDPYYNAFSGWISDIAEITLVPMAFAAMFTLWKFYKHHQCHDPKCHLLGRKVEGLPYVACHKHHPDHTNDERGTSAAQMAAEYKIINAP